MVNPYQATTNTESHAFGRRAVRRYLVLSSLLISTAILVAYPGLELLNQKWQLFPTQTGIFDVEINGHPVSNETAIRYTVGTGILMSLIGFILLALSFANWQRNRKICDEG